MQESGRSAKEKPSRKGWASMCDISLIVLSGRLRQAPVVGFQAGKIVPGLGIGCLQLCHILRGRLSSARKHHMTFFSESHRCRLISPPTQISYGEPARLKPGGAYGGADKMSFLFAQTLGCILLQDTRRWGIPLPFFSIWIVAKSHEPCAGQQLVPYTMAAPSRTRHRFPMREPAKARASGKDRFPHLFSSLKKTGFPLSSRR